MAKFFLERGYVVCGCARSTSTLDAPGYEHEVVDVGDGEKVRAWVRGIVRRHGSIDVAICNAGLAPAALLMTMTGADVLEPILHVNVAGTYHVCREVARTMMTRRSGRIITVSSMAVGLHEEGTSAYAASKSAVVEMTKILAKELAPLGITCNVLAPSMYETEAVAALGESVKSRALEKLTIKRPVTLEEICGVLSFFAAPESACITGQVIHMGLVT
jgi:3-oxoacyl-[acyl-carrier protein] reductase